MSSDPDVSTLPETLCNLLAYSLILNIFTHHSQIKLRINHLNAELNPIYHLLALLGVHHFLRVSRIRVISLTLRLLMSYIYIYIYIYEISSLRVKIMFFRNSSL